MTQTTRQTMPGFFLAETAIETGSLETLLRDEGAGALASFSGWVRNRNEGRDVVTLEYEAFPALAHSEGQSILVEAIERFSLLGAVASHRQGVLKPGDVAVWVGITAVHRHEAFRGCRYVIDEIKLRLPIWKREVYADGSSEWVNCRHGNCIAPDVA